ncbi:hypothetical protein U27_01164 [Candidatus Vecturithrix granuli]|uniref:DUF5615 domain-containing protein n=1 Tax=Vecturithrix granuli TaxID=1499967 RepID=A0A081C9K9_VECG1|nr:hypothetical protein U27_01164 [Candidatus Vecturithrix granuli]
MFKRDIAQALREDSHDVIRASEIGQDWADDQEILQKAIAENRILVTLDKHFGDWAILPFHEHSGVIRLKVNPTTSQHVISLLLPFLRMYHPEQLRNCLLAVGETFEQLPGTHPRFTKEAIDAALHFAAGDLLFRVVGVSPEQKADIAVEVFQHHAQELQHNFSVVSPEQNQPVARQRAAATQSLPSAGERKNGKTCLV